eukprot:Sspe_Gene.95401::Locus_67702_Transcript_1_1_Confidence_1.000_Length_669::g.95401::m.95401
MFGEDDNNRERPPPSGAASPWLSTLLMSLPLLTQILVGIPVFAAGFGACLVTFAAVWGRDGIATVVYENSFQNALSLTLFAIVYRHFFKKWREAVEVKKKVSSDNERLAEETEVLYRSPCLD